MSMSENDIKDTAKIVDEWTKETMGVNDDMDGIQEAEIIEQEILSAEDNDAEEIEKKLQALYAKGRRELTPEEQEAQSAAKPITISMSPPKRCPGCGLKTHNLKDHGYPDGLLMFPIPNMGICHFTCPKCFIVFMNKECFETQKKLRAQQLRQSPGSIMNAQQAIRRPQPTLVPNRIKF